MGKLVLALALRVHQLEKIPNICFTFFYVVGREIGKKLVYKIQICAQKLCMLTCAHKISCRAFESVISACFSAREIFFAKATTTWEGCKLLTNPPSFAFFFFLFFLEIPSKMNGKPSKQVQSWNHYNIFLTENKLEDVIQCSLEG